MPRTFAAGWVALSLAAPAVAADPEPVAFFEAKVRPLLVAHCVGCHGPTAQKGSLRLDTRDGVLKGGDGGPAAVAGKPNDSPLVAAVRHATDDLKMPPAGKLPAADIGVLERWVALGLPWPENVTLQPPDAVARAAKTHWAFRPVRRSPVPQISNPKSPIVNPVDGFVRAKLAEKGLTPSPEADRRTLVRRAFFDLHGLPPTPAEVAAFEADTAPGAWERLIDRLLASPRYGERWGRHWLDVARYADNKGYVLFQDKALPWAWTYRDYVIGAFNADKPFDRFVREQLAADQLKLDDPKDLAALGFLTVGGQFMNNTHDVLDDRIDVVTRGLLGLTVTCARCHDHKFDPIPQADYYSLYGVFRSCAEPPVPPLWGPPPADGRYLLYDAELKLRERAVVEFVTQKHRELVAGARARAGEYLLAAFAARNDPPADDFMLLADKGDLNPSMVNRWRQHLSDARKTRDPVWRHWHAFADLPETEFAAKAAQAVKTLDRDAGANRLVREAFALPPGSMKEVAERYGKLLVAASAGGGADAEPLRAVLYGPRSPADAPLAMDWGVLSLFPDRPTQGEYQKLLRSLDQWLAKGPPRAMVLADSPQPYEPVVFERGQPGKLGAKTPRQFLAVANPARKPFTNGSGRSELANEIASKDNPLTARVFVNRVWLHHFGKGLVGTPSDFGLRSDPPTHPDLLDWLAAEFVDGGWSVKKLHRLVMTSATYRQASRDRADALAADPENRLLWKANRRRLELEPLHDAMLAVSGGLSTAVGGPPAAPFAGTRRAVYWSIDRLDFPPTLATFDVPSPAASSPQRTPTTVAPQALFLMNGPFARGAAQRLLASPPVRSAVTPALKLDALFLTTLSRKPTAAERAAATALLNKGPDADRWLDLAHGLLMANEFAFVD